MRNRAVLTRRSAHAHLQRAGARNPLHPRQVLESAAIPTSRLRQATPDLSRRSSRKPASFAAEVLAPLNQVGDEEGCKRNDDGSVTDPDRIQGGLRAVLRGRLADPDRARGIWRPRPAAGRRHGGHRIYPVGQPQLRNVPGPDLGRDRLAAGQGQRRAQAEVRPNMVTGRWTGTMNLTEPHCGPISGS